MPRGGAVVHGAAALSSCASTESLEAIGRLTKRIATFVDGHATGHWPSWVRTNAGRSMRDSSSLSVGCGMHNIRIGPLAERTTRRASKAGVPPPSCAARRNVRAHDRVHGELGGCCARD
jgi:hypothetical protein